MKTNSGPDLIKWIQFLPLSPLMICHFCALRSIYFILFSDNLCNGKFHKHLQDLYAPLVVRYVDLMESSIAQSIYRGFERESWEPVK